MANNNSNVSNRIIQNIDHPFTELFELLPQFQKDCQPEILRAIEIHTKNAAYLLTTGLQSLGTLLATGVGQTEHRLAERDLKNLGWLVAVLSDLLECCMLLREEVLPN